MLNQETGIRGYIVTGDGSSLQPYRSGRARVVQDLAALRQLAKRRPEIAGDVASSARLVHGSSSSTSSRSRWSSEAAPASGGRRGTSWPASSSSTGSAPTPPGSPPARTQIVSEARDEPAAHVLRAARDRPRRGRDRRRDRLLAAPLGAPPHLVALRRRARAPRGGGAGSAGVALAGARRRRSRPARRGGDGPLLESRRQRVPREGGGRRARPPARGGRARAPADRAGARPGGRRRGPAARRRRRGALARREGDAVSRGARARAAGRHGRA